jgi:hypothetical protein
MILPLLLFSHKGISDGMRGYAELLKFLLGPTALAGSIPIRLCACASPLSTLTSRTALVKSFGRREAYESLRGTNPGRVRWSIKAGLESKDYSHDRVSSPHRLIPPALR